MAAAAARCTFPIPAAGSCPPRPSSAAVPGLATGAGYGIKTKHEPHVAVGFFGDGALEEGLVIECFNIAALWKLPVVYVCENNSPGAMGPQQGGYPTATTATDSFTRLPAAYGIHCLKVDGTDVSAVHAAAIEAVQRCRDGNGPVFIEAFTTRWPGSSPLWPELATVTDLNEAWDPARIAGPHADWLRHHDPLLRAARELVAAGFASRDELMARDKDARARIAKAANFAIASPMPDAGHRQQPRVRLSKERPMRKISYAARHRRSLAHQPG